MEEKDKGLGIHAQWKSEATQFIRKCLLKHWGVVKKGHRQTEHALLIHV